MKPCEITCTNNAHNGTSEVNEFGAFKIHNFIHMFSLFLFYYYVWSSSVSSWHFPHLSSHYFFFATVSVSIFALSGVRRQQEREVFHAVTHWSALGPMRRRPHASASHPISFDKEMAMATEQRQFASNDLCSLNQNNKYMSLASVPGYDLRLHKDHNAVCMWTIVHLVHCAENDQNDRES